MTQKKCLVSLSGGMDSATLLAVAHSEGLDCTAVGFTYGSTHNQWEQAAAMRIVNYYKIPFISMDLSGVFRSFRSNLLGSGPIPEGHYEAESMKQTVVPGRNLIFMSVMAGLAQSHNFEQIWVGVHSGDHAIYPDCRPNFIDKAQDAIFLGSGNQVSLRAPFLNMNKTSIITEGLRLKLPYEWTRTCYKPQPISCGKCGSCQERLEAFKNNGIEDPLEYESREILPK